MMAFIEQEANEKAEEIDAKVYILFYFFCSIVFPPLSVLLCLCPVCVCTYVHPYVYICTYTHTHTFLVIILNQDNFDLFYK